MKKLIDTLAGFGVPPWLSTSTVVLTAVLTLIVLLPQAAAAIAQVLFVTAPVWLPLVVAIGFLHIWIRYTRARFIAGQDTVLLEVKVPREIAKSPRAMEAVFEGLSYNSGETTFINRWIEGKVRPWFSFEITSFEGRIHFYVWTRRFFRDVVEAQIYAQYPGVEIYEVEDYARAFSYDPSEYSVKGSNFILSKDDPFPIKTYIDYELDKDPKEEYKIDPIAHLFEYLSAIGPGEQVWLQIIIRTNRDKRRKSGTLFKREDRWKSEAKDMVAKIREESVSKFVDDTGKERPGFPNPTSGQKDQIDAIERSVGKTGYDVGIRGIYIAKRDAAKGINFPAMLGIFKQFGSGNLNSLRPHGWHTTFDYPWQDFRDMRQLRASACVIDAYKRRSWFYPPYRASTLSFFASPHKSPAYVMTSEELATIYHFPSRTIEAPGLDRIPATKAEAPPNLPTSH